jgi:hypothetical protein
MTTTRAERLLTVGIMVFAAIMLLAALWPPAVLLFARATHLG